MLPLAERAGYRGSHDAFAVVAWIVFARALAALSIVGDLHESLLKRRAGVNPDKSSHNAKTTIKAGKGKGAGGGAKQKEGR